ncbi:MAG: NAD(P)-binding domain-containing protein [Planctomycetota bacterium]
MKIATIGTGSMAKALGLRWAQAGHDVWFGSRDASKAESVASGIGHGARGGENQAVAAIADVIFYTVRGVYPSTVLDDASVLSGKVVLDCNNFDIPSNFDYDPITISLAEQLQADVPDANVVKFANTMAAQVFDHAPERLAELNVTGYVAGDDDQARATAVRLASDVGLTPHDCGTLLQARLLEGLANFIRFVLIGQQRGPFMSISTLQLPEPQTS